MTSLLRIAAIGALASLGMPAAPANIQTYLEANCVVCHSGDAPQASLDLATLPLDSDHPEALELWIRAFDRVQDGEMPPKAMPPPDRAQTETFLKTLNGEISAVDLELRDALGRVRTRRLNRVEYENTLHDLLGVRVPLADLLPEDSSTQIFDTVATSQQLSHFVLEKYLAAADVALDAAYARALEPLQPFQRTYTVADLSTSTGGNNRQPMPAPDGSMAVAWSTSLVFVGRMPQTTVRQQGWYRIRLRASAVNPDPSGRVWATLRTGECYARAPSMFWISALELTPQPRDFTFDAWIRENHMLQLQPGDYSLPRPGYGDIRTDPYEKTMARGLAGAAIHALEMERIFPGDSPEQARERLFGDATIVEQDGAERASVRAQSPRDAARRLLTRFAARAFRRPVGDAEVRPYLQFVEQRLDVGVRFDEALRSGYRALLVSPKFLFLPEQPGPLSGHAIAARLSYMLWSTMPDEELLAAAADGRLPQRDGLDAQVERMLSDSRAKSFIERFTGQWLDLRDIDFTQPDRDLFPDFDDVTKFSMLDETQAFVGELLEKDLSVRNIVDSNFTMLNARLARHYGLEPPQGLGMRRVTLPPGSHRGGLLTHGSVLKVTANGTNTSPVVRGAWVTERILGRPVLPPPPNVSAIEPDVRGAKTIREQLALHRSDASCAACHRKIDPPGFALENYDPTGKWRERYPVIDSQTETRTTWKPGPEIDPSYELADGTPFSDFESLRRLFADDTEEIARNVAEKLVLYGTGAQVGFAGRSEIAGIVERAADSDYGLRSLLHEVVASPLFLNK